MKKYKIAIVGNPANTDYVKLITTDLVLFDWFKTEIKAQFPNCRILGADNNPPAYGYGCSVDQLSGKDWEVSIWLLNHLCTNGWEPFAVEETRYHFRYLVEN